MNNLPLLNDLRVFMLVARRAGFAAVAEELGVSPAFVSKRIALLEQTLNVVLLHRTTRRVTITEEGERIYEWAQRILQDVGQMMDELSDVRQVPQGMLRIISSFGFGRQVVAPALSALAKAYPQLELRFDVEDRLVDLVNEGVDLDIRIGDDIAPNLIARKLATNYRILCASPEFIAQHGAPKHLTDLLHCRAWSLKSAIILLVSGNYAIKKAPMRLKSPAHCRLIMEKLSISGVSMGRGLLCVPGGMLAKHCQWSFSASATGILPASERLGRLCFKAGDVSESADNGRIFTPVFCRALPEFFTGACLINDSIIGLISG